MTMSEKKEQKVSTVKDVVEITSAAVRWGALLAGGFCLLYYCTEIGHFPEGIELGEGLAFYLISVAFMLICAFYITCLTALGSALVGLPTDWLRSKMIRRRAHLGKDDPYVDVPT